MDLLKGLDDEHWASHLGFQQRKGWSPSESGLGRFASQAWICGLAVEAAESRHELMERRGSKRERGLLGPLEVDRLAALPTRHPLNGPSP